MINNIILQLRKCTSKIKAYSTVPAISNQIEPRHLLFPVKYQKPRQVWLESLDTIDERKVGLLQLHPKIFGASPRIDIVHQNVRGGGVIHGPRSPTPHFYMLTFFLRLHSLTSMLSIKLAQDDLHVVENLELPNDEIGFIEEFVKSRNWGPSVLFVDDNDIMPRNITASTDRIKHFNLMPNYGLNVYSMLKHDTLVLTKSAVETIEQKLLTHLHRNNSVCMNKFKVDQQ